MTRLDELNRLLKTSHLHIPDYVREVHASGKNLKWLRKNLGHSEDCPARIKELLELSIYELLKPAQELADEKVQTKQSQV